MISLKDWRTIVGCCYDAVESDRLPPDIHIYTASKQPWVILPPGTPAVAAYYRSADHWPAASLERRVALLARAAPR